MSGHSRSPRRRTARAALVLAALAVLPACGDDTTTTAPLAAPAPSAPGPSAPAVSSASPSPDDAQRVQLTVTGSDVTGDTGRVQVALGRRVRITVVSDVADEVHVHGYDVKVEASPGAPVELELVADKPGVFEVELERSGRLLTRLQVQ